MATASIGTAQKRARIVRFDRREVRVDRDRTTGPKNRFLKPARKDGDCVDPGDVSSQQIIRRIADDDRLAAGRPVSSSAASKEIDIAIKLGPRGGRCKHENMPALSPSLEHLRYPGKRLHAAQEIAPVYR